MMVIMTMMNINMILPMIAVERGYPLECKIRTKEEQNEATWEGVRTAKNKRKVSRLDQSKTVLNRVGSIYRD